MQLEEARVELTLEVDNALKGTLKNRSERALFLSNLGKINTEAFLTNPDMGRFPTLDGNTYNGPTMFITGEKKPSWECDTDVRTIRQLFPNSFFVKVWIFSLFEASGGVAVSVPLGSQGCARPAFAC